MAIRTTCIGAFPKPNYVPIKDWFQVDVGEDNYQEDVIDTWSDSPEHDALFRQATAEVIKAQINCGITIPTDGEQRRENYVHYQCRQFSGFDFKNLERRTMRNGAYDTVLPAIRGDIKSGEPGFAQRLPRSTGRCGRPPHQDYAAWAVNNYGYYGGLLL